MQLKTNIHNAIVVKIGIHENDNNFTWFSKLVIKMLQVISLIIITIIPNIKIYI